MPPTYKCIFCKTKVQKDYKIIKLSHLDSNAVACKKCYNEVKKHFRGEI